MPEHTLAFANQGGRIDEGLVAWRTLGYTVALAPKCARSAGRAEIVFVGQLRAIPGLDRQYANLGRGRGLQRRMHEK